MGVPRGGLPWRGRFHHRVAIPNGTPGCLREPRSNAGLTFTPTCARSVAVLGAHARTLAVIDDLPGAEEVADLTARGWLVARQVVHLEILGRDVRGRWRRR